MKRDFKHELKALAKRLAIPAEVPDSAYVIEVAAPLVEGEACIGGSRYGWAYSKGWNGSFHDDAYSPVLLVWAKGPHRFSRANRLLRKARAWLATRPRLDSAQCRFAARSWVREGD